MNITTPNNLESLDRQKASVFVSSGLQRKTFGVFGQFDDLSASLTQNHLNTEDSYKQWFREKENLLEYQRRQDMRAALDKFIKKDIPLSALVAGLSFLAYRAWDDRSKVLGDLSLMIQNRNALLGEVERLAVSQSGGLAHQNLSRVHALAKSIEVAQPLHNVLSSYHAALGEVGSTGSLRRFFSYADQYVQSYKAVVKNRSGLKVFARTPVIASLASLSPERAGSLAYDAPERFLRRIFGASGTTSNLTPEFFTSIHTDLKNASMRRSRIFALGYVFIGLVGMFLTSMEMKRKKLKKRMV